MHWLKIILQIALLWLIFKAGDLVVSLLHIPVPGNVFGMLLLFGLLTFNVIPLKWVEEGAGLLLKHMAFFFIPIAVGLMIWGDLFLAQGIQLLAVVMLGAVVTILTTAYSVLFLAKKYDKEEGEGA
ncbi:CidA/LrgA family protein [Desulfotomaculum sp. 1211_IL3151]|uniref:CidA/LrgA family protein n=1 Tax=Desulfotomaculum sp. 1211_IL3151 TaxID=3084055 RepID=UPI002FD94345